VPARWLRGDEPEAEPEAGDQVLQRPGHGGAVDQGGKECSELDAAVVPPVQGQPGAAPAVRPGLQPGQLPAAAGAAPTGAGMDADDPAGEADQDRGRSSTTPRL